MPTKDVPMHEWPEFLETFSREHRSWLTRVELSGGALGEPRPFGAVTTERDGRRISAIEVSFAGDSGGDTVRIENPVSIRVRQTAAGADQGLEIMDDEGFCTRLGFRTVPESVLLDGVAPGEISK